MQCDEIVFIRPYLNGYHYLLEKKKESLGLEKTINLASDRVNVDVEVSRSRGKTGDGLNISSECVAITTLVP